MIWERFGYNPGIFAYTLSRFSGQGYKVFKLILIENLTKDISTFKAKDNLQGVTSEPLDKMSMLESDSRKIMGQFSN